jgi:hypothetical protein
MSYCAGAEDKNYLEGRAGSARTVSIRYLMFVILLLMSLILFYIIVIILQDKVKQRRDLYIFLICFANR